MLAKNGILEWMIGNDPSKAGSPQLHWANFPESWGVFVLIALVIALAFAVFWMYRREINTCPMRLKLLLAGIRLAVLLFLIALFLKPSVVYQQISRIKSSFVMLRDASLSIDRGDQYRSPDEVNQLAKLSGLPPESIAQGNVTRAALLNQILKNNPQWVEAVRGKGAVRVIDFADGYQYAALLPALDKKAESPDDSQSDGAPSKTSTDPEPSDNDPQGQGLIRDVIPELVPDGHATDIWQALKKTLDDSSRISSIILLSDGQHNGSEDPIALAQKAAELNKPIFVIGLGDPHRPKNLAVTEVTVRDKAYPDEPFEVKAILQTSAVGKDGMPSQLDVRLVQHPVDPQSGKLGAPKTVASKSVPVPNEGGRIRVDFDHVLNRPGQYAFSVEVDPIQDESNTEDNQQLSSTMEVVDEKVKVLLISGLPSWDYLHVQRLLQRDQSISLSCWLQSMDQTRPQEGNEPITRLPRSIEELGQYNVVIMMDPNPEEFDYQWMELLRDFCKYKAGGVLFMAGPHFTSEFVTMNRLKEIRKLLPVKFGDNDFIDSIQALADARNSKPGKMLLVNHNLDHPVMSFHADPAETQKVWSLMPGIYWSFPTVAAKPTARVLLERGDQVNEAGNQPIMVTGRYGAGTVLYMGFQGTWKWRPVGVQAQFFDRFWIQVIRYLVETRSLQGSRRGFIDIDKTEFELGDRVTLIGRVLDPQFKPSTAAEVQAVVRSADGRSQKVTMKKLPQQEGRYEGTWVAQRIGNFEATIQLAGETENEQLIDPISFRVIPPNAETGTDWLNEKLLSDIATLSGGKYYRLDDIEKLTDDLPQVVTTTESNSPPEPLWDMSKTLRWIAFSIPVFLLSIEWIIRKWCKLL